MNIRWIIIGHSSCGHYCSAQGTIQQLGAPGVALSNIVSIHHSAPHDKLSKTKQAIALHTFFVIFFNWNSKNWLIPTAVNILIWAYLVRGKFICFLLFN